MSFERELETYQKNLPSLLQNEGKFVLIHEDQIVGIYGTYEDALQAGYDHFKLNPFFVKQISAVEKVYYISRLASCPT